MRSVLAALMMLAIALPLIGEAQQGVEAPGWQSRLDRETGDVKQLHFRTMGTGLHATTGPAAIFWRPQDMAKGTYSVTATFVQTKPSNHPNALGLLFGGSDLSGPNQRYSYFEIREDGRFLIKKRNGPQTPTVIDWTDHKAINKLDAQGRAKNTLTVEVGAQQVRFLVNGTEVATQPRSALDTEGTVGLRVNHFLDVHIDGFKVG